MKNKYTRKVLLSLGLGLLGSVAAQAQQKIGGNLGTLNPGAVLELEATNKGFLLPRISIPNLGAWGLPGTATEGMMVYNNNGTTGAGYYVWSGGAWTRIATGTSANDLTFSNGLTRTGNAITLGGALAAPTTLTLGTQSFTFNASGSAQVIIQGPAGNTAGLRLSNLTGAGTAGTSGQKVLSVNASGDVVLVTDFGSNNAGTVTNVTGTAPITVTNGTTTPVIGINQAALDLNSIGGTLPISKITPSGTAGQVLTSNGASAPTWTSLPTNTNIYNSDGTLSGARIVNLNQNRLTFSTGRGDITFGPGHTNSNARIEAVDTLEFQVGGNPYQLTLLPNGRLGVGTNTPTQRLHVVGGALISGLAGSGTRMVVADPSGLLSSQNIPIDTDAQTLTLAGNILSISGGNSVTLPSATNLYTTDGTLTGARTVTMGNNLLTFNSTLNSPSLILRNSNSTASYTGLRMVRAAGVSGSEGTWDVISGAGGNTAGFAIENITSNLAGLLSAPFQIREGVNGNMILLPAGGNVGIGTTAPTQRLHVSGGALISSLAGTGSRMVVADASGVLSTQAIPTSDNIYNANGTLTGARTVNMNGNALNFTMGTGAGNLQFDSGNTSSNARVISTDTLELQTGGNAHQLSLLPNGNVVIGSEGSFGARANSTSRIDLNGSISHSIRRISGARTLDVTDYTIIANAFAAGFTITLPAPNTCSGRVYVIRKVDESSNALTFTFAGITGTNAIRVSDSSATVGSYINTLNYTRTLKIQSDGTDWYLID